MITKQNNHRKSTKIHTHVRQIGYSKHKTYGVQDIRLPSTIQAGDSVEFWVKTGDFHSVTIRFETVQHYWFNMHLDNFQHPLLLRKTHNKHSDSNNTKEINATIFYEAGTVEQNCFVDRQFDRNLKVTADVCFSVVNFQLIWSLNFYTPCGL